MNNRTIHHALPRAISVSNEAPKEQPAPAADNQLNHQDEPDLEVWMSRLRDTWFNDINQMDVEDHRVTDSGEISPNEEDCR